MRQQQGDVRKHQCVVSYADQRDDRYYENLSVEGPGAGALAVSAKSTVEVFSGTGRDVRPSADCPVQNLSRTKARTRRVSSR